MPVFNENVDVHGTVTVDRPWFDWAFLRQRRDTGGGGGFHIHNPWGNSNQPQGDAARNRLEIAYRDGAGRDLWGQMVLHGPTGNVGLGTVHPRARLEVNGDIVVSGDIRLQNGDCAEDFDLSADEEAVPGKVMVLTDDGGVAMSSRAYDRRVAGVVAGAGDLSPAIRLGHREEQSPRGVPLALVGRVNCWVDASEERVGVGDLLTTGENRGCAMKAVDTARSAGAVLGKALGTAANGVELVPVLVALQ